MAIIYSYQENEELRNSDMLVGTASTLHNGQVRKVTKNFTLGQLKTFISTGGLTLSNGGTSGPATLIDNVLNIPVYQGAITLTTTGSTGSATLIGNTLNIPVYSGGVVYTFNAPLTESSGNVSISQANTTTNGYLSSTDWNTFNGKQNTLSGTGVVKSTAGTISYINGTSAQYIAGDGSLITFPTIPSITPAALTRTNDTNVTLTLGGAPNTALLQGVSLTLGWDGTLADSRIASAATWNAKQNAITLTTTGTGAATFIGSTLNIPTPPTATFTSLTTTGSSGSSTLISGVLNVPTYTLAGLGGITLASLSSTATGLTYTNTTGVFSLTTGYSIPTTSSQTNWDTAYTNRITSLTTTGTGAATLIANVLNIPTPPTAAFTSLTTTGSSGSSTLTAGVLNVPTYTLTGLGGVPTSRTLTINGTAYDLTADRSWSVGTVTSVGLSMPSAFTVSSSPVTGSGTIAVTGAGVASQYVRGDGTLANFPTSTGGGASVSYYLNGSVSQGTIGGVAYKEMNSIPVIGTGTDFSINADGYIAQFITDAGDPNKLLIPGGNWNFETYFSASSGGGTPRFYIELYKYDGTTFTLIASNATSPEFITGGTSIDLYFSALAVPPTTLTVTDRLAVRFYVIHSGRTITMHTENSHLSQVITTFSSGLTALNGLTSQVQYFVVGTSGTDFNISSATDTHTFNLPTASATNRGALSSTDWSTFNSKQSAITLTTTGSSGSSAFIGSTLNIPTYTLAGLGGVPTSRTLTINGTAYDLSADRTWNVGTVISVSATGPITSTGGNTPNISTLIHTNKLVGRSTAGTGTMEEISIGSGLTLSGGILSSSDTFTSLTTTGSSGSSTLVSGVLNVPTYTLAGLGGQPQLSGTGFVKASGTTISYDNTLYYPYPTGTTSQYVRGDGSLATFPTIPSTPTLDQVLTAGNTSLLSANVGELGLWDSVNLNYITLGTTDQGVTFNVPSVGEIFVAQNDGISFGDGALASIKNNLLTASRAFQLPDASGTIALTSDISGFISGSGTTNYVPKFTSSSAIGDSVMYDNGTNVGIGTTSPQAKLHSNSDILTGYFQNGTNGIYDALKLTNNTASNTLSGNGARIQFYNNSNNGTNLLGGSIRSINVDYGWASDLVLSSVQNNGYSTQTVNDAVWIKANGNVGIGTTNPASKLQSSGTSSGIFSALALESLVAGNPSSGNGVGIDFRINNSGNPSYVAGNISLINTYYRSNTDMAFSVAYADTLNERMRITSNGYVGIGTSVPTALLDVAGDALINGVTVGRGPGNDDTNTVVGNGAFSANISAQNNTIIGKWAGIGKQYGNGNIIIGANNYNSPDGAIVDYSNTISISRGSNIVAGGPPHIWAPADVSTNSTVDVITVNYTAYRAMFVEYVIEDESGNIRGGYIKGIWNNNATIIKMTEETTSSIGVTTNYVFDIVDNGSYSAALQLTSTSGDPVYCSVTSRLLTRPY